ncbi:lytic transglycosylase [Paracoccaceae bacterium GXU_MW_L88]
MKRFLALFLVAFLGSCGSGVESPPSSVSNACVMKRERPHWFSALERNERRWGVPVHVQLATIWQESKFVGDARPPHKYALGFIPMGRRSSALGYSQALDGTWDEYVQQAGRRGASRTRFSDAIDFMGWYMDRTERINGIPKWDAYNQYLAYHEGNTGFRNKSYLRKSWLPPVARGVAAQAVNYELQLRSC